MSTVTDTESREETPAETDYLISVTDLAKHFPIKDGAIQRVVGQVRAVDGVSFNVKRGETVGVVGESGCGKTTLGRCVSGLMEPTAGGVYFDISYQDLTRLESILAIPDGERPEAMDADLEEIAMGHRVDRMKGEAWRRYRRNCQIVFQDSFASLNPRQLVNSIVGRPLRVYKEASGNELTEQVVSLLEQVGLGREHLYRYPHQFSGGQRQRISVARALALDPELVVLDEPTSALDVSVQAQILNLLHELQRDRGLAYLFITHDLQVVRHMADRVVVMYLGKVAEAGETSDLFDNPRHPYTEALLAASPDLAKGGEAMPRTLEGSVPDPARPPQGCRFHTRCPVATPICGWEIDDVVLWLEDHPGVFEALSGVSRHDAFEAELSFEEEEAAGKLREALQSEAVPRAMREAVESISVEETTVKIKFHPVDEVELTERAQGHVAACVLDDLGGVTDVS